MVSHVPLKRAKFNPESTSIRQVPTTKREADCLNGARSSSAHARYMLDASKGPGRATERVAGGVSLVLHT